MRYTSGTNRIANQLRALAFPKKSRTKINQTTYTLSLTDCYWMKPSDSTISFEEVSPYYAAFWKGENAYQDAVSPAIPTLYTCGARDKYWNDKDTLFKVGKGLSLELSCILLCNVCNIPVESGKKTKNGICVENFTSPKVMLEQADMSGQFDPEEFTDTDIVRIFKNFGIQMLTIDAIIGNGDRHTGNFGFLRDADTGAYLGPAPLYDFDHALDAKTTDHPDLLMQSLSEVASGYEEEITRICNIAIDFPHPVFSKRAACLKTMIEKQRQGIGTIERCND